MSQLVSSMQKAFALCGRNLDRPNRFPREKAPSVIELKNKLRLGHSECCNCCCCKVPQFSAYKYIQPERPKPFRPIRCYQKSDIPMEDDTTYRMSYWDNPTEVVKPIKPEGCLTVAEGPIADETTQRMSYLGNWCIKPQEKILPCKRDLFGHGPIQDCTTQKHDFTWKYNPKADMIKYRGNLCLPRGPLEENTTYRLSFFNSTCHDPSKSFKPIRSYERACEPMEGYTTYRLSFFDNPSAPMEKQPWQKKLEYIEPTTPLEGCTTYKLSYWPQCADRVQPIRQKSDENLLNRGPCFEDDTTYGLSYFGGDGDHPGPILPRGHQLFGDCPLNHDTTHKMSYMGNWCPKPVRPILPCTRQLLGRGPVQSDTTQKCDFTWKCKEPNPPVLPLGNFDFSQAPLESCTTNRLSYMVNCPESLIPTRSFAPLREYMPADMPMDMDTTMQLSYQPVPGQEKVKKPWAFPPPYHKPTTSLDDNTTYALSYMPPGTLIPCCPKIPCCPASNSCSTSMRPQVSVADTRPCISC